MKMHFKDGIHEKNIIVRCAADRLLPFALTFGIYIIIYGTISPGGGFQGGVTVASAILFLYLAYGYNETALEVNPEVLRINEAIGASIYVILGLAGILTGMNFCRNWLYDIGAVGDVISAGTVTFMGYTVGYKVLTGVGFLLILMLGLLGPDSADTKKDKDTVHADTAEPVRPGEHAHLITEDKVQTVNSDVNSAPAAAAAAVTSEGKED